MKAIGKRIWPILVTAYGLLYGAGFILPILNGAEEISGMENLERNTIALAFLVFALGAIVSWFHGKWGGLILGFWHVLVWVFSLMIWTDAGMILLLIFPVIFPATFLITDWYTRNTDRYPDSISRQKLTLQVLFSNYAAVYLVIFISDILPRMFDLELRTRVDDLAAWEMSSPLGLLLMTAMLLFFISYILSWTSELWPGILLIIWYLLILLLSKVYFAFANSGPWTLFGIPVLVQGMLYLKIYLKKRRAASYV